MPSVIINFCSLEKPFIEPLLIECQKFSNDIVVSYGSHLYNGEEEDLQLISELSKKYPHIQFVKYIVDRSIDVYQYPGIFYRPSVFWFTFARYTGFQHIRNKEWIFFIDADEIPNGNDLKDWLNRGSLDNNRSYKLANYYYFKSVKYQSLVLEDSPILIHYSNLNENIIIGDWDRDDIIRKSNTIVERNVKGIDDTVLFHHFSWVRSRENVYKKLLTSADVTEDRSVIKGYTVEEALEKIYDNDSVNDIIHNYNYKVVDNIFNIIVE
jgi:hypothetical protein